MRTHVHRVAVQLMLYQNSVNLCSFTVIHEWSLLKNMSLYKLARRDTIAKIPTITNFMIGDSPDQIFLHIKLFMSHSAYYCYTGNGHMVKHYIDSTMRNLPRILFFNSKESFRQNNTWSIITALISTGWNEKKPSDRSTEEINSEVNPSTRLWNNRLIGTIFMIRWITECVYCKVYSVHSIFCAPVKRHYK